MLHSFLSDHRNDILELSKEKTVRSSGIKQTTQELERGLPILYDELIEILKREAAMNPAPGHPISTAELTEAETAIHGRESYRLGYTISQVVHGYGAICQAITESAHAHHFSITPREFQELNTCLDVAIASAVSEFYHTEREETNQSEVERLGFLAHELRNNLMSAIVARKMIVDGQVGNAGNTGRLLDRSLNRMTFLIDRSLSEVRLRAEADLHPETVRVVDLIGEVEATAIVQASQKDVTITVVAEPELQVSVDRQLLISAIANLVQNAVKFTQQYGAIVLRGFTRGDRAVIEVEDECGGLPEGSAEKLFKPFVKGNIDRTGLGLGLSISRKAVELNGGQISCRNLPGKGCVFSIDLPRAL